MEKSNIKHVIIILIVAVVVVGAAIFLLSIDKGDKAPGNNNHVNNEEVNNQKGVRGGNQDPNHKHEWVAVKITTSSPEKKIVGEAVRCTLCNADITDNVNAHMKEHEEKGEKSNAVKKPVYEKVMNEKEVIDHYKCSCGAVKK